MRRNRRIDRGRLRAPSLPWPAGKRPVPESRRTCAGCGQVAAKAELTRLARVPSSDRLEWRKEGGRGTYLHAAESCENLFVQGRKSLPGLRLKPTNATRAALIAERTSIRLTAGKKD